MLDWERIRFRIVCVLCALILLATGVAAPDLCQWLPHTGSSADDSKIEQALGALGFFCIGFGVLARDALSLLFFRVGFVSEFRPTIFYYSDTNLVPR